MTTCPSIELSSFDIQSYSLPKRDSCLFAVKLLKPSCAESLTRTMEDVDRDLHHTWNA